LTAACPLTRINFVQKLYYTACPYQQGGEDAHQTLGVSAMRLLAFEPRGIWG
jgi:hypothetical protein